ncbi:hypothetical protein [Psychrobacter sp. FDAARGOS_221]|uniref:hypothetical protein n=1 Tax=Psychrobacter sp. FDAARGOS_221 TaxID=1975705 RepID=UPI000BB5969D|nr:hypothetical protein [Psychrobacter sp. FDAARGOS_221]PNK59489.1 hypothetical protein A6J60_000370 [Psychrobacter sp. FDAARGOS_221]
MSMHKAHALTAKTANFISYILAFIIVMLTLSLTGCFSNSSTEKLSNATVVQSPQTQTHPNIESAIEVSEVKPVGINNKPSEPIAGLDVLEVYTARTTDDGIQLRLFNYDKIVFVKALIPTEVLAYSDTNSEQAFELGDRVQIVGDYKRGSDYNNVTVVNVKKVHKLGADPAKVACESVEGREWRLVGMAQTPTCVTNYTDAGKPCQSSDECQGHCMVGHDIERATCAASNSYFGCGATIEDFRVTGSIICID